MTEWYRAGVSIPDIAQRLNEQGIKPPSGSNRAPSPSRPQGTPEANADSGSVVAVGSASTAKGSRKLHSSHKSAPNHRTPRTVGNPKRVSKRPTGAFLRWK